MERTAGGTLNPVPGRDRMPLLWASCLAPWNRLPFRQEKRDRGREEQEQGGMCGIPPAGRAESCGECLHLLLVVFKLFVPLDRGTMYTL